MPKYLIVLEDGTEVEKGFPGKDSEKIRETAKQVVESETGQSVVSIKEVKQKKTNSKKQNSLSVSKKGKPTKGKKEIFNTNSPEIKAQIKGLENALVELSYQIRDLKASVLLAKKQELLNQLDEIDSQL